MQPVLINSLQAGFPIRLLLVEAVVPVAPVAGAAREPPAFAEGQRLQATVVARMPDGQARIQVNGRQLQMRLPQNFQPGDSVQLTLVAQAPRLKFMLLAAAPASADASLSASGRWIGALAQDAAQARVAPPLEGSAPLLARPPADSRQLPPLLQRTLAQSGLFYESHQAQWLLGRWPLALLRQEPQGQFPVGRFPVAALPAQASSGSGSVAVDPPPGPGSGLEASGSAVAGHVANADVMLHERAAALVQQQLAVLESGQLCWRGEIWPEQQLEWDVAGQSPDGDEGGTPCRWQTRLHLTLPHLGEVSVALEIGDDGLRLALEAATAAAAQRLQYGRPSLAAALAAAGLKAQAIEVRHDIGK